MKQKNPTILLTIDVEDWFQVENLRPVFPPETWDHQELRVEQNTNNLLDLLDSITLNPTQTNPTNPVHPKATFFILGWIAKRCPSLVKAIASRGHEVASHGNNHLMCNQLNHNDLKEDLSQSKKLLEDITGNKVNGYRAPNFSINDTALNLVQSCDYKYDSSYNNFSKHGRYGTITLNGNPKTGTALKINKNFIELPISNLTIGRQIIPWGGGGYFRFFPPQLFKAGIQRILKKTGAYIFYMHPWEIDADQPRTNQVNRLSAWRHYLNLSKTHNRLKNMIKTFSHCNFPTCSRYLMNS
jgi:polysaccharide deacetylase family protein (PEP-CTERM system associated)